MRPFGRRCSSPLRTRRGTPAGCGRYNAKGGQRPLTGTLFIPQLISEPNVFEVFRHQVRQVCRLYDVLPDGEVDVNQASATDLRWLADNSVDYVFTDPTLRQQHPLRGLQHRLGVVVRRSDRQRPGDRRQQVASRRRRRQDRRRLSAAAHRLLPRGEACRRQGRARLCRVPQLGRRRVECAP